MRKKIAAALLLPAVMLLSSCDLMPEEAAQKTVPVVESADTVTYKTVQVTRGDLARKTVVYCTYAPLRTDTFYFSMGGEYVDEVYVKVGDTVTKGQLLAQLEMEDVDERIADGFYFARSLKIVQYLLANPALLDRPLKEEIDFVP